MSPTPVSRAPRRSPAPRGRRRRWPGPTGGGIDVGSCGAAVRPTQPGRPRPLGAVTRVRANLAAVRMVRALQAQGRRATPDEQTVLARWSGWGAVPEALDERREDFAWARAQLAQLLSPDELRAATRNTLNAHYTDLSLVQPIWKAVARLGFTAGPVLEPGCGSGNFLAAAPAGAQLVGVELEPITAAVAAYPLPRRADPGRTASPPPAHPAARSTWSSATSRSPRWRYATRTSTPPATPSTTTSSSSRCS